MALTASTNEAICMISQVKINILYEMKLALKYDYSPS